MSANEQAPQEPLRPAVLEFSAAMEEALRAKDAGFPLGWTPDTAEALLERP